jgi:hypothetical protein
MMRKPAVGISPSQTSGISMPTIGTTVSTANTTRRSPPAKARPAVTSAASAAATICATR